MVIVTHCTTQTARCTHRRIVLRDLMCDATDRLRQAGVGAPACEARRLWRHACFDFAACWGPDDVLPAGPVRRLRRFVTARARGVPLAYLLGHTGFLDFELRVGPGVLIPRPETEELAELGLGLLPPGRPTRCLDLGTGSGALALAVARARPQATVLAVDTSPRALACARRNVRRLGLSDRVEVRHSDWYADVSGRFDLIAANPPYVKTGDLPSLSREISDFEPRRALDGGADGLRALEEIISGLPRHLKPGGWALIELGFGQGVAARQLANRAGLRVERRVVRDMSGKERFLQARWI